ncbi:Rie1p SCDLUD_004811 [Saccharomycodes ludwigii]|uniref:Rie1p n=1 Tax=Saccharomycodes ludwigii TaxID=36035 RepID=UPI001E878427|nr:hypothetical protein SCDLUD_004811 [Saccharomycodes ludwigii]KAH3899369.1 hypothetical protein SCDLUD_004811 [Saccharomycodes ludwigii]
MISTSTNFTGDNKEEGADSSVPSFTMSQLEQLSNTNILTIRLASKQNSTSSISIITNTINKIAISLSSTVPPSSFSQINSDIIEKYQYWPQEKRLHFIKDQSNCLSFEMGDVEYKNNFLNDPTLLSTVNFTKIYQFQFKNLLDLQKMRDDVYNKLIQYNDKIYYAISFNPYALTHPGNLYIRGLPLNLKVHDIQPIFANFGHVLNLKIIHDKKSGQSLGYGFVSYSLGSEAAECVKKLNGKYMNGSLLFINYHVERKERERLHLDQLKEGNDDTKFRGVFIGNLPITSTNTIVDTYDTTANEVKNYITPIQVVKRIIDVLTKKNIKQKIEIVSFYFPKHNSQTNITYHDTEEDEEYSVDSSQQEEGELSKNAETCDNRDEISPLKGYGFMKFKTHAQALKVVELLNGYEWLQHKLVVNKAIQNTSPSATVRSPQPPSAIKSNSNISIPINNGIANTDMHNESNNVKMASTSIFQSSPPILPHPTIPFQYISTTLPQTPVPNFRGTSLPVFIPRAPLEQLTPITLSPGNSQNNDITTTTPVANYNNININTNNTNGNVNTNNTQQPIILPLTLPIPTRDQQESNLYIKHLPLEWTDDDLIELYKRFGEIISAKVITVGGSKKNSNEAVTTHQQDDGGEGVNANDTLAENTMQYYEENTSNHDNNNGLPIGASKGYAFVCFKNPLDASRAMLETNNLRVDDNHVLYVSFAAKRTNNNSNAGNDNSADNISTTRRRYSSATHTNQNVHAIPYYQRYIGKSNSINGINNIHNNSYNHNNNNYAYGNFNPKFLQAMYYSQTQAIPTPLQINHHVYPTLITPSSPSTNSISSSVGSDSSTNSSINTSASGTNNNINHRVSNGIANINIGSSSPPLQMPSYFVNQYPIMPSTIINTPIMPSKSVNVSSSDNAIDPKLNYNNNSSASNKKKEVK